MDTSVLLVAIESLSYKGFDVKPRRLVAPSRLYFREGAVYRYEIKLAIFPVEVRVVDEWGNALDEPVMVEVAETGAVTSGWGGVVLYAPKGAKVAARAKFLLFAFVSETFVDGPTELVVVVPVQTARTAVLGAAACAAVAFVAVRRKHLKAGRKAATQLAN